MMTLTINGADRTSRVQWQTLRKTDRLNQRTDSLTFSIQKTATATFTPVGGDEVLLYNDGIKIFGGTITKIKMKSAQLNEVYYQVECEGYTQTFDRRLVNERFESTTVEAIIEDLMDVYAPTFTYNNVSCTVAVDSIAFNRITLSACLDNLAKLTGYSYYIDYDKDLHFFAKNTEAAPFNLDNTSGNFFDLEISDDYTQIRNSVVVRGGEEEGASQTELFDGTGTKKIFALANKFSSKPTVTVGGVTQDVGVDFLNDYSDGYDVLWNYNEKYLRWDTAPASGTDNINVTGTPLFPVIVRFTDPTSIATHGVYEFSVVDKSLKTQNDALERASAELEAYKDNILDGTFVTYNDGLKSGQTITITNTAMGISSEAFLIQQVTMASRGPTGLPVYKVEIATLRKIEFLDFILNRILEDDPIDLGEEETLLTLITLSDSISMTDSVTLSTTSGPYKWGSSSNTLVWSFGVWQ